jgi:iron complex outermembrane receptor protein
MSKDDFFELSLLDLVNIKVTTASRSSESLDDTPVAVTVITSNMIERSGAMNIQQLLTRYVPGFTRVEDQNELNIAVRGVYTSSQQKILFLLNGHRLNSHSYSMASPDLSISLDKISQIEILRGPASAVYGNVALTAVVNIILKQGEDSIGSSTRVVFGDFGQRILSHTYGTSTESSDTFYWLNHASVDGESKKMTAQESYAVNPEVRSSAVLGGQTDKSSYDMGIHHQVGDWKFLFNARRNHYIEPFSGAGISGEPYNYNEYELNDGYGPGFGYESQHFALEKTLQLSDDWEHDVEVAINHFRIVTSVIIDPSSGAFTGVAWEDASASIMNTFSGPFLGGDILFGFQYDLSKVYNDELKIGGSGVFNNTLDTLMPSDSESIFSIFAQQKRYYGDHWLSNIGMRYDFKNRAVTSNIHAFSPRLALIYQQDFYSVKMSVAQSFVDSTYWNRFSTLPSFRGAGDLEPERLTSYQVSPVLLLTEIDSEYRVTLFYNIADDFIRRDLSATVSEPNFSNAGELKSWGIEQEWIWKKQEWEIRANTSYQKVHSYENYAVDNGDISNVPSFSANIITNYRFSKEWNVNLTLQYIGEQYSPIDIKSNDVAVVDPFPSSGVPYSDPSYQVDAATLIHMQLSYLATSDIKVDLQVDNLFNEEHEQGGTTLHPYPQTGRWTRLSVSYHW